MDDRLEMSSSNFGMEIQLSKTFDFLLTSNLQKMHVPLKGTETRLMVLIKWFNDLWLIQT
jgi:hypothetical protein